MTKKSSKELLDKFHSSIWLTFGFALVLLLLAYGGASWAIDNGSLWLYGATIAVIYWAFKEIKRGILVLFHKK